MLDWYFLILIKDILNQILIGVVSNAIWDKLGRKTNHRNDYSKENNEDVKELNEDQSLILTENVYAKRISFALFHINECLRFPISIEEWASIFQLKNVKILKDFLIGDSEPDFDFLDQVSNATGINSEWLKFGKGRPFYSEEKRASSPFFYFDIIEALHPIMIFFIRSDCPEGNTFVVLKINEIKYVYFYDDYHISSHVGCGGQNSIYSFFKLINKIKYRYTYFGRIINDELYNDILCGRKYCGIVDRNDFKENNKFWPDDFIDVDYENRGEDFYFSKYGSEFISAQKIVVFMREREKENKLYFG